MAAMLSEFSTIDQLLSDLQTHQSLAASSRAHERTPPQSAEDDDLVEQWLDDNVLSSAPCPDDTGHDIPMDVPMDIPAEIPMDHDELIKDNFYLSTTKSLSRPPAPCNHCRRLRLQCLIIPTTVVNPNPVTACSSCVALFRDCSLAEKPKRRPNEYETLWPVIGQLHGINEEDAAFSSQENDVMDMGEDTADGDNVRRPSLRRKNSSNTPSLSGSLRSGGGSASGGGGGGGGVRRSTSRSVRKTRVLRQWFVCHQENPYPSEAEKSDLVEQSGLSRTQVNNWFTNARRRERSLAKTHEMAQLGTSPMPLSSPFLGIPSPASSSNGGGGGGGGEAGGLTPFERWRNSPPEDDGASRAAIESSVAAMRRRSGSHNRIRFAAAGGGDDDSSLADDQASSVSSQSFFPGGHAMSAANSEEASSCYSFSEPSFFPSPFASSSRLATAAGTGAMAANDEGIASSASSAVSFCNPTSSSDHHRKRKTTPSRTTSRGRAAAGGSTTVFECTFCRQRFKKKYDWARHERSVHLPSLLESHGLEGAPGAAATHHVWQCGVPLQPDQPRIVWRMGRSSPECVFCGFDAPDEEHFASHEFGGCEAPVAATTGGGEGKQQQQQQQTTRTKTFSRKDHLWQHFVKFHNCRRWEGWGKPDLDMLRVVSSSGSSTSRPASRRKREENEGDEEKGKEVKEKRENDDDLQQQQQQQPQVKDEGSVTFPTPTRAPAFSYCGCGFCGAGLGGWDERTEHIAKHFRDGLTMDDWRGSVAY